MVFEPYTKLTNYPTVANLRTVLLGMCTQLFNQDRGIKTGHEGNRFSLKSQEFRT